MANQYQLCSNSKHPNLLFHCVFPQLCNGKLLFLMSYRIMATFGSLDQSYLGEVTFPQLLFFSTQHLKCSVYLAYHFISSFIRKGIGCLPVNSLAFLNRCCFNALT